MEDRHVKIFAAVFSLDAKNKPVDFVTVTQFLRDCGELDSVGSADWPGAAYVTSLFTLMPTAANAKHHLEILKEKWTAREIISAGTEFVRRGYDEQDNIWGVLDEFEARAMAIRQTRQSIQTFTAREVMKEALTSLQWRFENPGKIRGLSTGFSELDRATDGLVEQELIVVAARPGEGKTALCLNIAETLSLERKIPVAVVSLEMSKRQLGERLVYSRAGVNSVKVRDHGMNDFELARISRAVEEIAASKLIIEEASDLTIQEFRARARQLVRDYGVKAIFVDSMSAMRSSSRKAEKRHLEVAECSYGFKQCAKELSIPIIIICHLGRDYEKRQGTPRLSDLRESGNIEQDADTVLFLDPQGSDEEPSDVVDIIAAKCRNGERGRRIPMRYEKRHTRFYGIAREENVEQGTMI
jgi:replicative DNA helicase